MKDKKTTGGRISLCGDHNKSKYWYLTLMPSLSLSVSALFSMLNWLSPWWEACYSKFPCGRANADSLQLWCFTSTQPGARDAPRSTKPVPPFSSQLISTLLSFSLLSVLIIFIFFFFSFVPLQKLDSHRLLSWLGRSVLAALVQFPFSSWMEN